MNSLWQETAKRPTFPALSGDLSTDVLIVGGGMAGLLCAYKLTQAGVECALVEQDRICARTTENTTAKLTVQHGLLYDKMIRRFGVETARRYFEAQSAALADYRTLAEKINCDFEEQDAFLYARENAGQMEREAAAYLRVGAKAAFVTKTELPFPVVGAVRLSGQAQFHPLKFAFGIAKGLPIFEHTKVLEFVPDGVITNKGRIRAKRIIVATHFPILNKHGSYFLKMYQHRSYVLALKNAPVMDGMYVDASKTGLSFRHHGDALLLGGGGHRTGKNGGGWRELQDFAAAHYKGARVVARWAAQDCMTLDGIPYIGRYSARTKGLYVATGFNKWGMTSSMVAATLLCDMLQGKEQKWAEIFSPSRSILHPQLALNAAHSVMGLLTPTVPRCPHLGCALKYNEAEHSWDCSCHGSRFGEDGKVLDGPASADKKI